MTRRPLVSMLAVVGALTVASGARGQSTPSLDLRGVRASAAAASGLYFEPASSPATFDFNGALRLSYAYQPLTLRHADGSLASAIINHHLSGDITLNMGLFERLAIGVDVPFLLYQGGDTLNDAAQQVVGQLALSAQALGDVALLAKVTLVQPTGGELGGFALALHQRLGLPTGDAQSLMAEGYVSSETRLLAEYRFLALTAHGALGVKLRDHDDFGCLGNTIIEEVCPTRFGHELPFGLGLSFQPQALGIDDAGRWTWFVESYGHLPLAPHAPFTSAVLSQAQLAAGARVKLGADVSLLFGVETALLGGIGTAPFRGTLSLGWAPRKHDDDNDGIANDIDQCPEELPEDYDGFEDDDGCPEWDNDDDGVPDAQDQCATAQEDEDGFEDDDGCPDRDNDGDGIDDDLDACPLTPGVHSSVASNNGCPDADVDGDGIDVPADKCPAEPEDKDGFEDDDGCPDTDNDGDGIDDAEDACRDKKGPASPDRRDEHGCPDTDNDGVADHKDSCPDESGTRANNGCAQPPEPELLR